VVELKSGSSAALGQVQPLLPAISNCGAAHPFGENRRFRKRLSRRLIGDSLGRGRERAVELCQSLWSQFAASPAT
jgi:hypothetical protein